MMKKEEEFEIFSASWETAKGTSSKSVAIYFTKNWDIEIEEYLTGDDLEDLYGDWDHEEYIIVKRLDAPTLMILLFKYSFNQSEPLTFSKLKSILREHSIECESVSWT